MSELAGSASVTLAPETVELFYNEYVVRSVGVAESLSRRRDDGAMRPGSFKP